MNKLALVFLAGALLAPTAGFGANARACHVGTLLDVQTRTEDVGTFQVGRVYEKGKDNGARERVVFMPPATRKKTTHHVTVALGDKIYTGESSGDLWGYNPSRLVVNDPVEACVEGKTLVLIRPDGKRYKTSITRIERNAQAMTPGAALPENN